MTNGEGDFERRRPKRPSQEIVDMRLARAEAERRFGAYATGKQMMIIHQGIKAKRANKAGNEEKRGEE